MMDDYRPPVVIEPVEDLQLWGSRKSLNFDIDNSTLRAKFREFFRNFRIDNVYIYREALVRNWNRNELFIEIDIAHLNEFDEVLVHHLQVLYRANIGFNLLPHHVSRRNPATHYPLLRQQRKMP